jgi:hypothetical protein
MRCTTAIGILGSLVLEVVILGCAAGSEELESADVDGGEPADVDGGDRADVDGGAPADVEGGDGRDVEADAAAEEVPVAGGCCTVEGTGCCEGVDNCYNADWVTEGCRLREHLKNGSEVCDDVPPTRLDPGANRYFLVCLNDRGGTAYVSTNSGGPCDGTIPRCQCWEQAGIAPWDELDYLARLVCVRAGDRVEVILPGEGVYHWGVHAVPGTYLLAGHCPGGEGCQTAAVLLELPR